MLRGNVFAVPTDFRPGGLLIKILINYRLITNLGDCPYLRVRDDRNPFPILTGTCSDTHTCLVPNDQHTQESLTPGVPREIQYLRPVLSSDVAALLTDTDADTGTATVNRVEIFEFR